MDKKILTPRKLAATVARLKSQGKKIVFTNGTFDILHLGHVTYLRKARREGDVLIVGVNTDRSVKKYKDPSRPVNPEGDRIRVLTALACVDYAILFGDTTPLKLILKIRPDVLVKGADWALRDIVGAKEVMSWGGRVKRVKFVAGRSSTRIIKALNLA
ncbi:MAG TPA: D-glycero-beta-D-manno-heptose 1-phosphate adenylyltransferase [Candidatus Omnitrophota bacterium]|jgi:D-beta-D-heptose 7-phosphate kinase/D-beta-D-heptose 1-phosphate adenosyltransferase|nr:MAG: Bifunctional protein HldE [Candidatus Omnitrophica bacterium ADurb.Bin314]HOE69022.1 D-glycero-beta-D-manno-heptose 1-phosphate adenylyltransferase [Candidatus Omnitrophota bacterium]HQB93842.1 D-glycero-beta-D-manno-heptose 1-phosphate adenylyltransferase [Candidatus Omnitrophota bacterium]